jgi:ectoine hydroxylase-related dioxygenase (phytanoyl-CoA dioxygenase family)
MATTAESTSATNVAEIESQGFTMIPGFVDRAITAQVRETIDRAIADGRPGDTGTTPLLYRIMHPFDAPVMRTLAADARLAEVARQALRAEHLRLRQQMFMKTTRAAQLKPPRPVAGGHVDSPFLPRERDATPRQTYMQFFVYCSDVAHDGGSVYVSPGSHKLAYDAFGKSGKDADREFYAPPWVGTLKLPPFIEVTGGEGDLIVFDPMCVHTGSDNRLDAPRYVYHCSYHDASATWIERNRKELCDPFPPSLIAAMPEDMRSLVPTTLLEN